MSMREDFLNALKAMKEKLPEDHKTECPQNAPGCPTIDVSNEVRVGHGGVIDDAAQGQITHKRRKTNKGKIVSEPTGDDVIRNYVPKEFPECTCGHTEIVHAWPPYGGCMVDGCKCRNYRPEG
jgi:hypothetical protein